jgi:hypothetical protein
MKLKRTLINAWKNSKKIQINSQIKYGQESVWKVYEKGKV